MLLGAILEKGGPQFLMARYWQGDARFAYHFWGKQQAMAQAGPLGQRDFARHLGFAGPAPTSYAAFLHSPDLRQQHPTTANNVPVLLTQRDKAMRMASVQAQKTLSVTCGIERRKPRAMRAFINALGDKTHFRYRICGKSAN